MAFKLVDNPNSSSNQLKRKYRAHNIINEKIPQDEYVTNRSGKFACRICPQQPVFDTIIMLDQHRQSGRHLEHSEVWEQCKVKHELKQAQEAFKNQMDTEICTLDKISIEELLFEDSSVTTSDSATVSGDNDSFFLATRKPFIVNRSCSDSDKICKSRDEIRILVDPITEQIKHRKLNPSNMTNLSKMKSTGDHLLPISSKTNKQLPASRKRHLSSKSESHTKLSQEEVSKVKNELKLAEDGWIKDSSGKWIKNEECEFDSDSDS